MKMSELLAKIGDDNFQIQNLDTCGISYDWSAKKGTTIKFGTEVGIDGRGTKKLGMIVWLDRDEVERLIHPSA
jgi:hypothetical protein